MRIIALLLGAKARLVFIKTSMFIVLNMCVFAVWSAAEDAIFKDDRARLTALSELIFDLENNHPQFKLNQAQMVAAKARTKAASQPLYNPEIAMDAERIGWNGNQVDTMTLGLNQTLDWHDKRRAKTDIARAEQEAKAYYYADLEQQWMARFFLALAEYQGQQAILQAQKSRLKLLDKLMIQADRLYQAGDISKLDLEQLRLTQSQTQLIYDQTITEVTIAQQNLVNISGDTQRNWPLLPMGLPVIEPSQINFDQIMLDLPTYQSALAMIAVAESKMRLRSLEQKADPTLGFRVGGEESDFIVGVTFSMPLNIRNNFQAEVDEAAANIRATSRLSETTTHQIRTRLKSTANAYQLRYKAWQTWQDNTRSSLQKQGGLLFSLWQAGELSTADYLLQLNQVKTAEMNNIELKAALWQAWFSWLAESNQFALWLEGKFMPEAFENE